VSAQRPEQKRKFLPIVIVGIILAALCGVSLYIRIALPHDQIFVNGAVWFRETDAYYYMRNIETLIHNFPHYNTFDPYMLFPGGGGALARPFFAWLVAGVILLVKGAASNLHSMEVVAAYVPAILGTLTLIPVYFIGKELFNRWVGVISAALVVVLPGEFLHRSLLGFTDHHVAEVLFSTVAILFLIMAIKRAREREISFSHVLSRDWPTITRPLIYTLLAGIFLGLYLLSWSGGLMFIFIIFIYLVIQFIVDHLRRKSSDYLCIVGTPLFIIALLMLLPLLAKGTLDTMSRVSLLIAILVPIALSVISRLMAARTLKPVYYVLALVGLTGIGLAVLHAIDPSLLGSMLSQFSVFGQSGAMLTVMEATGLLFPQGTFTFSMAWANFTTSFFISFIALVMLAFVVVKERSADKSLFVVWSVVMLLAVLGQRRFGYYYAVNAGLLTGYFSWKMLDIAGLSKLLAKPKQAVEVVKKFKKKKKRAQERAKPRTFMQPRGAWINVIVVGIVLFLMVIFWWNFVPIKENVNSKAWSFGFPTTTTERQVSGFTRSLPLQAPIMDEAWYNSCLWLQDINNTPDPFGDLGDPNFYYALYPPQDEFDYPESAYGVMSWWDYGYFIMQIGHRIPNANPGQAQAAQAGKFFTALNESAARAIVEEYNLGTKYIMIDSAMASGKFYAMAEWAGKNVSDFYEVYYVPTEEGGQWATLFYPAFYQSMAIRLYNFDGKAVTPATNSSIVISYEENVTSDGQKYKAITSGQAFSSYEDAQAYIASQTSGNYRIVSTSASTSPVPLEALTNYERVYPTEATTTSAAVKIFKYLGSD
jgi:oligosaccharyl transferase (archaeosortase A-associated)